MSSISTSAYYNVSSSSSNGGISGLMSGMDTETMVNEMLGYSQAKIDAKTGEQTQTTWKQEIYREIIDMINDFQNTFFNSTYGASSTTNLSSSAFWNNMVSAVTGGSNVNVVSTSSSATADSSYEVVVKQLASAATVSTGNQLSGDNTITASSLNDVDLSKFGSEAKLSLDVTVGDETKTIEVDLSGSSSSDDVINKINTTLKAEGYDTITAQGGSSGISLVCEEVEVEDGDNIIVSVDINRDNSNDLGIQYSGFTSINTLNTPSVEEGDEDDDGNKLTADVTTNTLSGTAGDFSSNVTDFTLTLNGVSKTITLNNVVGSGVDGEITADDVHVALQEKVSQAFGSYIEVGLNDNNELSFSVASNEQGHEIKVTGLDCTNLGFTVGSSSAFDTTQTLEELGITSYDFTINGVDFSFDADTTVASMMSTINKSSAGVTMSYSSLSDSITINADNTGAGFGIEMSETPADGEQGVLSYLFGCSSSDLNDHVVDGTDAQLVINGVETSRSSNTFTIDGITMNVTEVSAVTGQDSEGNDIYEKSTISTSRDTDTILEGITEFVNAYNELIEKLNGLIDEDASYKDYAPLTTAQKAEMSESEINLWEEKAKEGLLRNDNYVSSFLSSMRTTMYTSGGSSNLALYQIGITTSSDYQDKGKLVIDEAAFLSAFSVDPEGIADMFTNSINGLANTLETTLKATANKSSGSPGTLVSLAGAVGYASESANTLSYALSSISSRITQLEYNYELEKSRYWSQFTNMETVLSQYNSQSEMIMSYFA